MSYHEKTSIVDLMQTPEAEVSIESNTHLGYPEAEECGFGTIPPIETNPAEKQTIQLPDPVSIWKYLLNRNYGNQRLTLYSYLNKLLHSGVLSDIVGFNVMNRVINKEVLQLVDATFWKRSAD